MIFMPVYMILLLSAQRPTTGSGQVAFGGQSLKDLNVYNAALLNVLHYYHILSNSNQCSIRAI